MIAAGITPEGVASYGIPSEGAAPSGVALASAAAAGIAAGSMGSQRASHGMAAAVQVTADRSGHVVELQSLRGLAAAAVMIGHSLDYYATPGWFRHLALLFNGRAAVVVFFVLSGYVLTRSLRQHPITRAAAWRFYIQRIFRIYPAIWAASVLGLAYLVGLHWRIAEQGLSDGVLREFRPDRMDALHIVASFAGMLAFILPQLWSIFVEIIGSAAMPLIALVTLRGHRATAAMLTIAVCASYLIGQQTYYYVGLYFMDFVVGAALAVPGRAAWLMAGAPAGWLVPIMLIALSLTQFLPTNYYDPSAHLVESALAAGTIALLLYPRRRVALLASPPMVFLGDTSYSVYLLHYVVLCTLAKIFVVLAIPRALPPNQIALSVLIAACTAALTMPLAALFYRHVEKPGIALGKLVLARSGAWPRPLPPSPLAASKELTAPQ